MRLTHVRAQLNAERIDLSGHLFGSRDDRIAQNGWHIAGRRFLKQIGTEPLLEQNRTPSEHGGYQSLV